MRVRKLLRGAAGLLIACVAAVVLASPAAAHSVLLATTPTTSTTVAGAPTQVVLTFNEQPQQRFSTIHVTGPDGQRRDSGSVRVVNDNVMESLGGSRPAGKYVVDWRVISADGHPVSGEFSFTATSAAATLGARQADTNLAANKSGSSSTGVIIAVVIAVVVVGGLFGGFALRRRRHQEARSSFS